MKRKFLSFLMVLGAFAIASTALTSCKDYDDDIQDLQKQVTNLTSTLDQVKNNLTGEINGLRSRIETAEGQLATYKGEIDKLRSDVNTNAGNIANLEKKVTNITAQIAGLEARLETAEGTLGDLVSLTEDLKANKVDKSEFNEKITDIYARLEAVEEGLADALKAIEGLEDGLENERIAREAAVKDLQQQLDAVKKFEERIARIEADYLKAADKQELEGKIEQLRKDCEKALADQKKELEAAIAKAKQEAIDQSKQYTDQEIAALKKQLQALSDRIDALQAEVNVLTVLVKNSLRSLVFIPDGYYFGIEATKFSYLEAYNFKVPETTWKKAETRGYFNDPKEVALFAQQGVAAVERTKHNRYDSTRIALVEDLWANYHMNPSNVSTNDFTNVSVLSGDKWFEITRAANKADAGLSVKDWKVAGGDLSVQIDVKDPMQLKSVLEPNWAEGQTEPMVTVFATEVTVNKAGKDTTITSDYATLFADKMTDIRLAHIDNNAHATGQMNDHCGLCTIGNISHSHVMTTVHEAVVIQANHNDADVKTNAQDKVNYKETLDLRTLVETHWTALDGTHKLMTAKEVEKFGLSYKFDLTSLKLGTNVTDESAHAAILEDGYTFRPQLPRKNGTNYEQVDPKATDIANFIGENALQAVGRTPVVRVSLVDKNDNVLDYGYIRIEIVREGTPPPPPTQRPWISVTYDGTNKEYQDVCPSIRPAGYDVYATKWIQTEYDIYKALGVDRATFEDHYAEDPEKDQRQDYQQYEKDAQGNWVKRDPAKYVGVITNTPDLNADGTTTSTLKWKLTDADVQALYNAWDKKTQKTIELSTAVKYTDVHDPQCDGEVYKDVYVVFTTKVTFKPYSQADLKVKVDWSNAKIAKYWFKTNTAELGDDEVHTNVPAVEDELRADADSLTNLFSNEFNNNEIVNNKIVTGATGFVYNNYKYRLVFDDSNKGKQFKGASGKTYTLTISDDGRELKVGNVTIAKLVVPAKFADKAGTREEANYTMIEYQHNATAHDLLNYCSHNEFNNKNEAVLKDFLNVVISLGIQNDDQCKPISVENGTFNVRFLRPIDVTDGKSEIVDAGTSGKQIVYLNDLFEYQDWRNAWNPGYSTYYGIQNIKVAGLEDGDALSDNHDVKCDLNNDGMKALYLLTSQLDFTYNEDAGDGKGNYLEYNNLSSTVHEFKLEIPVIVEYIWGEFNTKATVTVKRTEGNAKKF